MIVFVSDFRCDFLFFDYVKDYVEICEVVFMTDPIN